MGTTKNGTVQKLGGTPKCGKTRYSKKTGNLRNSGLPRIPGKIVKTGTTGIFGKFGGTQKFGKIMIAGKNWRSEKDGRTFGLSTAHS